MECLTFFSVSWWCTNIYLHRKYNPISIFLNNQSWNPMWLEIFASGMIPQMFPGRSSNWSDTLSKGRYRGPHLCLGWWFCGNSERCPSLCDLSLAPATMMWTCFSLLNAVKEFFILCLEAGTIWGQKMKNPLDTSFYLIYPSETWNVALMASLTQSFWHVWTICLFFRSSKLLVIEHSTRWGSVPVRNDSVIPAFPLMS